MSTLWITGTWGEVGLSHTTRDKFIRELVKHETLTRIPSTTVSAQLTNCLLKWFWEVTCQRCLNQWYRRDSTPDQIGRLCFIKYVTVLILIRMTPEKMVNMILVKYVTKTYIDLEKSQNKRVDKNGVNNTNFSLFPLHNKQDVTLPCHNLFNH